MIDAERGFWGDPAFDLVAAEWERVGDPGPELVAGYLAADGAFDPRSGTGRLRVAFCRVYLGLQMLVEVHPRGYVWDGLDEHLGTLRERLATNLALLD